MNKVLIVHTCWYEKYIDEMIAIAKEELHKKTNMNFEVNTARAPGALELASLAQNKIEKFNGEYSGILFVGIIIRGETSHYDLVTTETFRSIGIFSEKNFNIAVLNNVICVENKVQLKERYSVATKRNTLSLIDFIHEKSL
ncbi:MAG: hypothetical protein DBW99_04490 [SAR86 cluster bacterium]|jgi:6,7-dimethyl-8-ribityllumazine synthase|nr:MAG: hypothetical protein DBW99_04490 [SAR86 cluster bacterium]